MKLINGYKKTYNLCTLFYRTYKQDDYKTALHTIGKEVKLMTTGAHESAMVTSVSIQSEMRTSEHNESGMMTYKADESVTVTTVANESGMMTTDANESGMMTYDAYESGVTGNNTRDTTKLSVPRNWTVDMYTQLSISVFGIIGNMFSLPVLYRKNLQKLPCILYLKVLTWADVFYLIAVNFAGIAPLTNYLTTLDTLTCKAGHGIINTAMLLPKYTVMGISMERFIAICFPLKGRHLLQSKYSKIYLLFVMIMLSISSVIATIGGNIIPQENLNKGFRDKICVLQFDTYPILSIVFYTTIPLHNLIPGLVILMCNVSMLVKITYSKVVRKNLTTSNSVTQKKVWTQIIILCLYSGANF